MNASCSLKLYVTGGTSSADHAVKALLGLSRLLAGRVQAEVIDVLLHPELVFDNALEPTPYLVRVSPGPELRLRGEIAEPQQLIRLLRLDE